jgi:hypothetical protein
LENANLGVCFVSSATPPMYFNMDGGGTEYYDVNFVLVGGDGPLQTCVWNLSSWWVDVPDSKGSFVGLPGSSLLVRFHPRAHKNCGTSRIGVLSIFASGSRRVDIGTIQDANPDTSESGIRRCEAPRELKNIRTKSDAMSIRG